MFSFKTIKHIDFKVIRENVAQDIAREIAPLGQSHVTQRQKVVSGWQAEHKPEFESTIKVTPSTVRMTVKIKNKNKRVSKYGTKIKDLWAFWNLGTKPHAIAPRFKTILRFMVGTAVIFARKVFHPGTVGHRDNERINKGLKLPEKKAIDRGVLSGLRRASKG